MHVAPTTHFRRIVHSIEHLHSSRLEALLQGDIYFDMPKYLFIDMMAKAFMEFKKSYNRKLVVTNAKCKDKNCPAGVSIIEFYSPTLNKKLFMAFIIQGGKVIDLYPCNQNCSGCTIPVDELEINEKEIYSLEKHKLYEDYRKENPRKSNDEIKDLCRSFNNRMEAIISYNERSNDLSNLFTGDVEELVGHVKYYNIEETATFTKLRRLYEAFNALKTLYNNSWKVRTALEESKDLSSIQDKSNWLALYDYLYFKTDWIENVDGKRIVLANNPEVYYPMGYAQDSFLFLKKFEEIQAECWEYPEDPFMELYGLKEYMEPLQTTPHILLADDEPKILDALQEIITQEGFFCTTCADGKEAWDILKKNSYDVLVTDIKMPRITGMELLDICKKDYPDMPVIIICGYLDGTHGPEIMDKGAFEFLPKPFSVDNFIFKIFAAIASRLVVRNGA